MAFKVDVTDRVDIRLYGRFGNERIMNTFSYQVTTGPGAGAPWVDFVTAFDSRLYVATQLYPAFFNCMPRNYTLERAGYQLCKSAAVYAQTKITSGTAGLQVDDALTGNLAAVITRRGDLADRRNVSTLHLLAIETSATLETGTIKAAYKANLDALATVMLDTVAVTVAGSGAFTLDPCIPNGKFSYQSTPIVNTFVQDTARVMRRRTVGLGE